MKLDLTATITVNYGCKTAETLDMTLMVGATRFELATSTTPR